MCNKYAGWLNRETWVVSLWINNDEYLADEFYRLVMDCRSAAITEANRRITIGYSSVDWRKTEANNIWIGLAGACLEDLIDGMISDVVSNVDLPSSMIGDLLATSVSRVDWNSIVEHIIDDYIYDNPDWLTIDENN